MRLLSDRAELLLISVYSSNYLLKDCKIFSPAAKYCTQKSQNYSGTNQMMNDITVADSRHYKNITIIFSLNNPIKNSGCIYPSLLLVLQYNYRMFSLLLHIFAIRRLSIAYAIKSMRLGMCCSYHHTAGSVYFWVLRQSSSSENTN